MILGAAVLLVLELLFLSTYRTLALNKFVQQVLDVPGSIVQAIAHPPVFAPSTSDFSQYRNYKTVAVSIPPTTVPAVSSQQSGVTQPPADPLAVITNSDGTKTYPFEQVTLWGYAFYTSKIDGSGSVAIGSQNKQTIGRLLLALGYPTSMTDNLAIMAADPTLMRSGDKFQIPWVGTVQFSASIQPEGGLYTQVGNGALILLNGGYDASVLTHELGHQIGFHMTDQEWAQYYELRGIPAGTPRTLSDWNLSPEEDFAEAYRVTYGQGGPVQTQYGPLMPTSGLGDMETPCYSAYLDAEQAYIQANTASTSYGFSLPSSAVLTQADSAANYDPAVQACRAKNNTAAPYGGGMVYSHQVGPATQQFINTVVARLSEQTPVALSRDSQRVSDLRETQNVLELYFSKCGVYPGSASCSNRADPTSWAALRATLSSDTRATIPSDPLGGSATYVYGVTKTGDQYLLEATLEGSVPNGYTPPTIPSGMSWTSGTAPGCAAPHYCLTL